MDGILILAHGSKRQQTERILDSIAGKVKRKTNEELVYHAYLQFSEQNLESGIKYLVKKGANSIKVVPLFLFDGIHVTRDIPDELNRLRDKYRGVDIKLCGHLGDDDRIADIIVDRIKSVE